MPKMPKQPKKEESPVEAETPERASAAKQVQSGILAALGRPPGLYEVSVRPLWGNHYRVNVLIGNDPTSIRIAHSYFIELGDRGDILNTTPTITRMYP